MALVGRDEAERAQISDLVEFAKGNWSPIFGVLKVVLGFGAYNLQKYTESLDKVKVRCEELET